MAEIHERFGYTYCSHLWGKEWHWRFRQYVSPKLRCLPEYTASRPPKDHKIYSPGCENIKIFTYFFKLWDFLSSSFSTSKLLLQVPIRFGFLHTANATWISCCYSLESLDVTYAKCRATDLTFNDYGMYVKCKPCLINLNLNSDIHTFIFKVLSRVAISVLPLSPFFCRGHVMTSSQL